VIHETNERKSRLKIIWENKVSLEEDKEKRTVRKEVQVESTSGGIKAFKIKIRLYVNEISISERRSKCGRGNGRMWPEGKERTYLVSTRINFAQMLQIFAAKMAVCLAGICFGSERKWCIYLSKEASNEHLIEEWSLPGCYALWLYEPTFRRNLAPP
jgi:hypothetical protein